MYIAYYFNSYILYLLILQIKFYSQYLYIIFLSLFKSLYFYFYWINMRIIKNASS